ncbi:MarR family winged helix-turn-helix transcriptional regulator [Breznakiella homolactica]|uniref:MarR family transcriptional regulator n=1 Tax=Breznakiella homolactica TaxID=2798577 RepID=A0A7T7XK22_9SPIR|nr:MarR family transcriptional regulator [Breznakiella homolactica]QQO07845.1 MarR family transcriptional regulator [Breznakiella homolactica]
MKQKKLTEADMKIWRMYKETFKLIFNRILKDSYDATGVSDGDFMVLDLLTRAGTGGLRQQELADKMDWSKSRLSHHLTRMEKRELVEKQSLEKGNAVQVGLTPKGIAALEAVRPVIANGIKRYFIDLLTDQDRKWIAGLAARAKEQGNGPR